MYDVPKGVMYNDPPPKMLSIKGCTTVNTLRQKIHSRLKLQPNQEVSSIVYRLRLYETKAIYMAVELCDNEDLTFAIEAYEHSLDTSMELYVDVATIESTIDSSARRQT